MENLREERIIPPLDGDTPFLPEAVFSEDVVLVTGGTSGMGLAMAQAFAKGGARLILVGRDAHRASAAVEQIEALGELAIGFSSDVRHTTDIAAAFEAAEDAFGPVSILANNAGANFPVLAETMSTNAWNAVTRIAIDGTFNASCEFARRAVRQGRGGVIINNSAQYIWTGFPGDAHSAAAKTAISTMTRALAQKWKAHHIRVHCVAAGFFPHAASTGGDEADRRLALGAMIPAGRVGAMQEFGWSAAFLCSPFAEAITGQTLMIDGGESLRRALMSPEFVAPNQRSVIWDYQK